MTTSVSLANIATRIDMLEIEAEVEAHVTTHSDLTDARGRRRV